MITRIGIVCSVNEHKKRKISDNLFKMYYLDGFICKMFKNTTNTGNYWMLYFSVLLYRVVREISRISAVRFML